MIIRQEKPSDYDKVCELVKRSFATNEDDDGTTHDYLNELRNKDCFIPELSLVAEHENGEIIGQIVLYKADIVTKDKTITELVLSPICVSPDYFNRGIARKMAEKSFEIAKELGYKAVFLCGEPKIYSRLGFSPTYKRSIYHVWDKEKNADWCMVRELVDGALDGISGTIDIV
jgi:predicted N-acetyltransferase YhbS